MGHVANISKSRFLKGLQCPKLLWFDYNAKHLFPEVDDALQAVFDQGKEVGNLAKRMFPNGIEIDTDPTDFEGAIQLTQKHLPSRRPIFEAAVSANGGFARADILNPVGKIEWDLIEVKSTTSLKDVHSAIGVVVVTFPSPIMPWRLNNPLPRFESFRRQDHGPTVTPPVPLWR